MSSEIKTILENISEITDSSITYSDKVTGAGYTSIKDPTHTVIYQLASFSGTITMQATLSLDPAESDWFSIESTETTVITPSSSVINHSFKGNYTWLRAAYNLQTGTISSIKVSI